MANEPGNIIYQETNMSHTGQRVLPQPLQVLHTELGIPADYADICGMPVYAQCTELCEAEPDMFGRTPLIHPAALAAWDVMKRAAQEDGVTLQIISAFRGYDYQAGLIRSKLASGQALAKILTVNAAPGFSEHHTGCALDIGCPDSEPLEEEFDKTPAFAWLTEQAGHYGFVMSFPQGNTHGLCYEPWHWCYSEVTEEAGENT